MKKNPNHKDNLVALRRIEGQVRGVQGMIENGEYCIDILNQIYAIKGALGRVEEKILKKHFQHCVTEAVKGTSEKEKQQKLSEILQLIHKVRK
jgi:DNA-binding FrmR family transcriptional regulator